METNTQKLPKGFSQLQYDNLVKQHGELYTVVTKGKAKEGEEAPEYVSLHKFPDMNVCDMFMSKLFDKKTFSAYIALFNGTVVAKDAELNSDDPRGQAMCHRAGQALDKIMDEFTAELKN